MGNEPGKTIDRRPDVNRPGDRQQQDNRNHKSDTGAAPNGVANGWLAAMRGKEVSVTLPTGELLKGTLEAFDAYSLRIGRQAAGDTLVFKGPGVVLGAV